ncbi:MAG: hypothetical protein GY730_12030, partial [bacterium]|nr:hypothetical protein [bacterium]
LDALIKNGYRQDLDYAYFVPRFIKYGYADKLIEYIKDNLDSNIDADIKYIINDLDNLGNSQIFAGVENLCRNDKGNIKRKILDLDEEWKLKRFKRALKVYSSAVKLMLKNININNVCLIAEGYLEKAPIFRLGNKTNKVCINDRTYTRSEADLFEAIIDYFIDNNYSDEMIDLEFYNYGLAGFNHIAELMSKILCPDKEEEMDRWLYKTVQSTLTCNRSNFDSKKGTIREAKYVFFALIDSFFDELSIIEKREFYHNIINEFEDNIEKLNTSVNEIKLCHNQFENSYIYQCICKIIKKNSNLAIKNDVVIDKIISFKRGYDFFVDNAYLNFKVEDNKKSSNTNISKGNPSPGKTSGTITRSALKDILEKILITAKLPEKGGHYHNIKEERKKNIWIALKNKNIPYIGFIMDRVDNKSNAEIHKQAILKALLTTFDIFSSKEQFHKQAILKALLTTFDIFSSKEQFRSLSYIQNQDKPKIQENIKRITTKYCPYLYQHGTSMDGYFFDYILNESMFAALKSKHLGPYMYLFKYDINTGKIGGYDKKILNAVVDELQILFDTNPYTDVLNYLRGWFIKNEKNNIPENIEKILFKVWIKGSSRSHGSARPHGIVRSQGTAGYGQYHFNTQLNNHQLEILRRFISLGMDFYYKNPWGSGHVVTNYREAEERLGKVIDSI